MASQEKIAAAEAEAAAPPAARRNCLCTLEPGWSFVPRWQPPFISEIANGDRCHLNGLAVDESGPRFVTVLGETDVVAGWREGKRDGGCLIDVASGEVLVRGLSMPHSPRLQGGTLWLLNSGHGRRGDHRVPGLVDATETTMPDRSAWLHWLAWTQWSSDGIREGMPWPRFLD